MNTENIYEHISQYSNIVLYQTAEVSKGKSKSTLS